MKIVIAGAGAVGYDIARHLVKEGKDVVVIERDPIRAKFLESNLDCMVLNKEINRSQTMQELDLSDGLRQRDRAGGLGRDGKLRAALLDFHDIPRPLWPYVRVKGRLGAILVKVGKVDPENPKDFPPGLWPFI